MPRWSIGLMTASLLCGTLANAPAHAQTDQGRIFYSGCPAPTVDGKCKTATGERMRTEILSIAPDGSDPMRITTNNKYEQSLVWSPSKDTIAFSKSADSFGCSFDSSVLAVVDSSGGDDTSLTEKGFGCETPTDWSADGRKILYDQECALCIDVYSIRSDGTHTRALTHFYDQEDPDIYASGGMWIDASRRVLYLLNDYPERADRLRLMDADGGDKHRYGAKALRGGDFDVSATDEVAFVAYDDERHASLYVGDATGANVRPVATDFASGISSVKWSPDGTKILFVASEGGGRGSLYVVDRDGSDLTSLDSPELDLVSTREIYGGYWSPDSTQIAFPAEAMDYQSHAVAVMDDDGSDVRVLTGYERHLWVWGWEMVPE